MVQFGDKHRWHTVKGRTTLLMNRSQYDQRIKLLNHHLRTAMRQTVHCGQYDTKAVEQRYTYAELIILRKAHVLTSEIAIIGDVIVSEHHALGESRCTAGVLHVHRIVAADVLLHLKQYLVLDILSQKQQFGRIKHTAILLHTDIYHVLQVWETFAVQMATLTILQFGQHGIGHVHIVTVPCTISDTKRMHIGVLTKILQLVLFVVRIYRDQHSADFRGSIKECQPVGHVSSPDTHIRSFLYTYTDQALGQIIHTLIELAPSEAKVTITIDDILLIRRRLSPMFQPLAQCALRKGIARTSCLGRICSIRQWPACHI